MPMMRITPLGRQRMYLTRVMTADDGSMMAEIEPSCVDAARTLGYAEDIEPEPAPRRGPGRPRKVRPPEAAAGSVKADEYEPTRAELLEEAKDLGVELPSGYVRKDDLIELVEEAKTDDEES